MILKSARAVACRFCLLSWVVAAIAAPAAAQSPTFDLEGVVTDAQQGVLPGATVTLQNVANGLARETATDASGRYVFTSLPPAGQYILQTSLAGFASERRENERHRPWSRTIQGRHDAGRESALHGKRKRTLGAPHESPLLARCAVAAWVL